VERVSRFRRALSFVTSIGPFQASAPIDLDELVDLALHGIAGGARAAEASARPARSSPEED